MYAHSFRKQAPGGLQGIRSATGPLLENRPRGCRVAYGSPRGTDTVAMIYGPGIPRFVNLLLRMIMGFDTVSVSLDYRAVRLSNRPIPLRQGCIFGVLHANNKSWIDPNPVQLYIFTVMPS